MKSSKERNLKRYLYVYTLVTDGLQPIKLLLFKELLCKIQ